MWQMEQKFYCNPNRYPPSYEGCNQRSKMVTNNFRNKIFTHSMRGHNMNLGRRGERARFFWGCSQHVPNVFPMCSLQVFYRLLGN